MPATRRLAVLATSLLAATLAPAVPAISAGAAPGVELSGTLLVLPPEAPGAAPGYAVQTDAGTLVPVIGILPDGLSAGSRFAGTVTAVAPDRRSDDREPRRVTAYALEAPSGPVTTSTTHRWYLAVPGNFGPLGMTDADLVGKVRWVADYWKAQSAGVITDITVPAGVTRYTATATTEAAGCGLSGADFSATVNEAAASFPSADFGGSDQLLVLVPPSCSSGGVVGRGTVGAMSLARGGYTISKADPAYFEWTLAHELGHNYGYGHSGLGPCSPSCASEYGDYYSVMGGAISGKPIPPALGTVSRRLQSILQAGEVETITGGDTTVRETRVLQPRTAGSGLRSLTVVDPETGAVLQVDYRAGTDADAGSYYVAGSSAASFRKGVVVETNRSTTGVALLPGPSSRKAMVAGDSLTVGRATISVTTVTSSSATVEVTVTGALPAYPGPGSVALSGPPQVGVPVSAVLAGWSPTPSILDYVWLADGVPIGSAGGPSYTPTGEMSGRELSVRVTAVAVGYQSASRTSAARVVASGVLDSSRPVIRGKRKVGRSLRAVSGRWTDGTAFQYRWFVGDQKLHRVHGARLTLRPRMSGLRVKVVVVGRQRGYATLARTSRPTARIRGG
jgi:hypothetical protein